MDREVAALYRDAGRRFEPRWYGVFAALRDHGPLTVGELSRRLGISHAAVSQIRAALEAEGLLRGAADHRDGRRHVLSLTSKGHDTAASLAPLWSAIDAAVGDLLAEHAPTLPSALDALEQALDGRTLRDRVVMNLKEEPDDTTT